MTCRLPKINNQKGSIMIIALLIMATLAIAGLLATSNSFTESRVGRNYAIHMQCVAAAEAAAKEIMQAIDSIFEGQTTSIGAIAFLDTVFWQPEDDYNTTFNFNPDQWATYNRKPSNLDPLLSDGSANPAGLAYLNNVGAMAVLVDQTTSALTPGLSGTKMREHFEYDIYCRAEHAGAPNSEAMLILGYRQEKI